MLISLSPYHFESEKFDFDRPISPAEFQWGIEIVRIFQPSWQDNRNRGMWTLPSSVEATLRHTPTMLADRQKVFVSEFSSISRSVFTRELATYQLVAINHLMDQRTLDFKSLKPRRLNDIHLALGLSSKKDPSRSEE